MINNIFTVEITSFKLDYNWKPGSTGQLSRPSMKLLRSAHPRPRMQGSNPGHSVLHENTTCRPLSWHSMVLMFNFNQSVILHNRSPIVPGG